MLDSAGASRWAFGRAGDGPGEFRDLAAVAWLDDTTLAASDTRTFRLTRVVVGVDSSTTMLVRGYTAVRLAAGPDGTILLGGLNTSGDGGTLVGQYDASGNELFAGGTPDPVVAAFQPAIWDVVLGMLDEATVFVASIARPIFWIGPPGALRAEHIPLPEAHWHSLQRPETAFRTPGEARAWIAGGSILTNASRGGPTALAFAWRTGLGEDARDFLARYDFTLRTGSIITQVPGWVVYIGGDTVATLGPVSSSFSAVQWFRCRFGPAEAEPS